MSTADDLDYDDDLEPDEPDEPDPKQGKRDGFLKRKLTKAEQVIAERDAEIARYKRRDALTAAQAELAAQGPLAAFLRTYDGEPDADAIRKAVAADPDFAALVTFPPDPRDVAAKEQGRNAAAMSGTGTVAGQIDYDTYVSWPLDTRLRFQKNHPELADMLAEGKPVPTPVGWA